MKFVLVQAGVILGELLQATIPQAIAARVSNVRHADTSARGVNGDERGGHSIGIAYTGVAPTIETKQITTSAAGPGAT